MDLGSTREVDSGKGRGSTEASFELVISNLELDLYLGSTKEEDSGNG